MKCWIVFFSPQPSGNCWKLANPRLRTNASPLPYSAVFGMFLVISLCKVGVKSTANNSMQVIRAAGGTFGCVRGRVLLVCLRLWILCLQTLIDKILLTVRKDQIPEGIKIDGITERTADLWKNKCSRVVKWDGMCFLNCNCMSFSLLENWSNNAWVQQAGCSSR